MNVPRIVDKPGYYQYIWDDEHIEVRVSRTHFHSDGHLTAEVSAYSHAPGFEDAPYLGCNIVNLSSVTGKKSWAKANKERYNHTDWDTVIEQVHHYTQLKVRTGEPAIELEGEPETKEEPYTLYPLIPKGESTIMFAPGGSGKSYFADYLSILVQYNHGGIYDWLPSQANVLYLDWETSFQTHLRRINWIKKGLPFETEGSPILYRKCYSPIADEIDAIRNIVSDRDIGFVVVDSATPAESGEYNNSAAHKDSMRMYNALNSTGCTCLVLDHVSKTQGEEGTAPINSIMKYNRARSVYSIKHSQANKSRTMYLGLWHTKMNDGMKLDPIGVKVEFVPEEHSSRTDYITFSETNVKNIPAFSDSLPSIDRILDYLSRVGDKTIKEISNETNIPDGSVKRILNENKDTFVPVNTKGKEKTWGLLLKD